MNSIAANLTQIFWLGFSLVHGGLLVASAILLLRERSVGPVLMLIGGAISMLLGSAVQLLALTQKFEFIAYLGPVSGLGAMLFATGLLIYALNRRAPAKPPASIDPPRDQYTR